jgi:(p)ppGpp synthase/HD superfamily hydrolase
MHEFTKYDAIRYQKLIGKTDRFIELLENYSGEDRALIEKAYHFACEAHKNQKRKASAEPYVIHCIDAACYLMEDYAPAEDVAAGLLHDVPEDEKYTHTTLADLKEAGFPEKTLAIVSDLTEKDKTLPWSVRKNNSIEHLIFCDYRTKCVKCADKISNLESMLEEYEKLGEHMWTMGFKGSKEEHKQNFLKLKDALSEISDTGLYQRYCKLVDEFQKI